MPRKSAQQVGFEFELRVRTFLERLGFRDVAGGRDFRLAEQIDACGGHEGTLVVVECKTTTPSVTRSILDDIRRLRGQASFISEAAKGDEIYSKYQDFRYVIATSFEVREVDNQEAEKDPQIFLWDPTFIEYYDDLIDKIGEFARFNLLGELGVKPRVERQMQLPAFEAQIRDHRLFGFFADPRELLQVAYVARREIGREKYYQRLVEESRLSKIGKFLDDGGYFPNAIIIAFGEKPRFAEFAEVRRMGPSWPKSLRFGYLSFPATFRSCWIVDGQHRLYGITRSEVADLLVDCVALEEMTPAEQAQMFLDVNKNQKPVPADLVWDLEGEMRPDEPEGIISRVAKEINTQAPLAARVYIPLRGPRRRGQLKFAGVCSALKKPGLTREYTEHPQGGSNPLYRPAPESLVSSVARAVAGAFRALDITMDEWPKRAFWYQNSGVAVYIAIFERILNHVHRVPSEDDYRKYLGALRIHMERYGDADSMERLRLRCSSEGGRDEVVAELVRGIRTRTGDENFGPDVPAHSYEDRIKRIERGLASLIATELSKITKNWFKERVPEEIRTTVTERRRRSRGEGRVEDFLTLGECAQIIRQVKPNWDALRNGLLRRDAFRSEAELDAAFDAIGRFRSSIAHLRAETFTDSDEHILIGSIEKFENATGVGLEVDEPTPEPETDEYVE